MNQFLKSNIKLKISIGFMLAFISFIAVQILSNRSIENLRASEKEMLNSNLLSSRIGIIESSINAYESKISDFICTGNKKFLNGNEANLSKTSVNLQYVLDASKNDEQRNLIMRLDSLVNAEVSFSQQTLVAYDISRTNDAVALIGTGEGEQIITNITNTSRRIQQLEENNLARIMRNNESYSRKVASMDNAATAFAIAVILFSIYILFRDINKRIRVEHQLRVAQEKAEQSGIMKEQFMANMSHEIRTPMNAIIGFANLLCKSTLDEKQKKHVTAIQTSGENLLTIINDILDFSKIEAGMVNIEKIPFSPAALLHSVNVMFLPRARGKKIQFDLHAAKDLPGTVIGDPTRLTQILINLISNAMKFTREGGISVNTEILYEESDSVAIQFTVKDTGIGIPENKQSEIFERFIQADTDTSRKYGGTGLGLSITKKLVELQGGSIHVESAEGVGSSFSFFIPYHKTNTPIRPALPQKVLATIESKIKILVVEDNLLNQHLAESLLTNWGFTFDIVDNGKLAIKKLTSAFGVGLAGAYDLILMDIQMPEMNGYDTARIIRQELNLDLPIIAMTAHVLPGERDKCLSYGMTDYISKPIRENELYDLIAKYVGSNYETDERERTPVQSAVQKVSVINLAYVKELSNGNPNFLSEMINLFLMENPKEIRQLEAAIERRDMNAIGPLAHKINSTIPFVGLNIIIGSKLTSIEKLAHDKSNIPRIERLFSQIKETCYQAIHELENINTNHV